ncbi:MAG: hypothetical protein ACK4N4_05670 [Burkholderiales bacterium]
MDSIGGIKSMENGLGGRKPGRGQGKFAPKNNRSDASDDQNAPAEALHSAVRHDPRLGQKIDTTA